MIEQAKGITKQYIKQFIDESKFYDYVDLHELSAELVLKDTHYTEPIVTEDSDGDGGYTGEIVSVFKSKVEGVPDIRVMDFYGTCSYCDTLCAIYETDEGDTVDDLATMVLHTIQSMEEI